MTSAVVTNITDSKGNTVPYGVGGFPGLEIDMKLIADALQPFIKRGYERNRLLSSDLMIVSDAAATPTTFTDINDAISNGTPIFDALGYFSIAAGSRPAIKAEKPLQGGRTKDTTQIAEGCAYLFFWLLTRANVPDTSNPPGQQIPSFLTTILGLNQAPSVYINRIAGFDLKKIEHKWIQQINIPALPSEVRNRFALGVAGYRAFAPFLYLTPVNNADVTAVAVANIVKTFASSGFFWEIHPIFRDPALIQATGSLNKELSNLALQVFNSADLQMLATNKIIFQVPVADPRHNKWRSWTATTFANAKTKIIM